MLSEKQKAFIKFLMNVESETVRDAISRVDEMDDNYMVLTDEEADEQARDCILDSLWAFNKDFLDAHSEAISELSEKEWRPIQELCESANKVVLKMIDDIDYFIEDAIKADGRGHFISSYDGEEDEQKVNGTWYYIYRIN